MPKSKRVVRIFNGPGGICLCLDSSEIIPNDPGAGTPAMVKVGRHFATFGCALDTGELDCGDYLLSAAQVAWLVSMANEVDDFLN